MVLKRCKCVAAVVRISCSTGHTPQSAIFVHSALLASGNSQPSWLIDKPRRCSDTPNSKRLDAPIHDRPTSQLMTSSFQRDPNRRHTSAAPHYYFAPFLSSTERPLLPLLRDKLLALLPQNHRIAQVYASWKMWRPEPNTMDNRKCSSCTRDNELPR